MSENTGAGNADLNFIGGLRYGRSEWDAINVSFPFAHFSVYDLKITIKVNFLFLQKEFLLPRADIESFALKKLTYFKGIQIIHNSENVPSFLLLMCYNTIPKYEFFTAWQLHGEKYNVAKE